MTFYLDVIWLLNLLVDSILLWLTGIFLKRQLSRWRILLGGFIGSCIILLTVTPFASLSGNPMVKLLFSFFMVYTAFGFKRFRFFFSNLLMFYFVTFLTGGILIGTHYFIGFNPSAETSVLLSSIRGFGDPISWIFVMLALPIAWYFSKGRIQNIETIKIQYDQIVDVTVKIEQIELNLKGLVDSGNQLVDPITKTPVMIVAIEGIKEKLPNEVIELTKGSFELFSESTDLDPKWSDRLRFIPAQSVGSKGQILTAVRPDQIGLKQGEEEWFCKKALVVFRAEALSADHTFQCIVHPKMMAEKPIQHVS